MHIFKFINTSQSMKNYDIIVIGSGAGAKIARPAAQKGLKAAIIEKDKLGGTCLNRGCIPSKMLIHPADVVRELQSAKKFNLKVDTKFDVNFSKLTKRINDEVGGVSNSIKTNYESGKIENLDFYYGEAKFTDEKVLEINGKKITAKKIVIAVGARPNIPPIPGLEDTPYWTSTEALKASKLPERLIIIGGGYIGVELGHAYGALGSKVHFMTRGGFVGQLDDDIRDEFTQAFGQHFKVHEGNTKKVSYNKEKKEFSLTYEQDGKNKTIKADNLLVATGVKPNNDLLGLENTKVKVSKRGFIEVNKHLETSTSGIYALGDCVGNYMFRHSANFEAEYLFDKLVEKTNSKPISYPPMPWAIFTHPQVAGVGYSEKELKEKGIEYVIGKNSYKKSAMGDALQSEYGFTKLLFDKNNKRLLGASIIGEQASIMIHMCIVLLTQKATLDDFFKIIYIHPALPEIVRNAARNARSKFESS